MRLRNILVLGGSALLLAGCLRQPDFVTDNDTPPQYDLGGRYQAAKTANSLATPALIKDCSERVAAAFPKLKTTGPYGFSPRAAVALSEIDARMLAGNQFAVLAAPTVNEGLFGQAVRGAAGCSYLLENGKLAFRKVHHPSSFREP